MTIKEYKPSENPKNQSQPLTRTSMKLVPVKHPKTAGARSRRVRKNQWIPA